MEKYLEVNVAKEVDKGQATSDGTGSGNGPNKLNDSGATFTASVAVGDWVYVYAVNGTPQASPHLYQVAAVTSNTELSLTPRGATAGQGTGVVNQGDYKIFSNTVGNNQMISCSNVALVENLASSTANILFDVQYGGASGIKCRLLYGYSDTAAANEEMRNGFQSAMVQANQQNWPEATAVWLDRESNAGVSSPMYRVLDIFKV